MKWVSAMEATLWTYGKVYDALYTVWHFGDGTVWYKMFGMLV